MKRLASRRVARAAVLACVSAALLVAPAARAGIFDDDEARRAILDLRQKLEQSNEQQRARQAEQMAVLTEQVNQMRRSMLDLNNQLEQMRGDSARLRGQNEQLTRDVSDMQRKQKDLQSGVEDRIRKIEPQKVTLDGREFTVEPDERRQYEESMALLRKSDFNATAAALTNFRGRYPTSGYTNSVLFWLGNAQYGIKQYREAIASFRALITAAPNDSKAPEALLAIANCQAELKDGKTARKTIEELLKAYPQSEAAQAGKERLASIKP